MTHTYKLDSQWHYYIIRCFVMQHSVNDDCRTHHHDIYWIASHLQSNRIECAFVFVSFLTNSKVRWSRWGKLIFNHCFTRREHLYSVFQKDFPMCFFIFFSFLLIFFSQKKCRCKWMKEYWEKLPEKLMLNYDRMRKRETFRKVFTCRRFVCWFFFLSSVAPHNFSHISVTAERWCAQSKCISHCFWNSRTENVC